MLTASVRAGYEAWISDHGLSGVSAGRTADPDGDGRLSYGEFIELYSSQFDNRDANKDGVLTIEEMTGKADLVG
jgi:hypothetical protein